MSLPVERSADQVLDEFAEAMFRLIVARYQRHLAELDLTMVQAQVLRLLHGKRAVSTGEIASELGISAPAVTQLTDRLIRKQLIERRSAPGDRRSVLVALTPRGRRAMEHFRERRGDIFRSAMQNLNEEDSKTVLLAMGLVVRSLEPEPTETAITDKSASKLMVPKRDVGNNN